MDREEIDYTGRWSGISSGDASPSSAEEVAALVLTGGPFTVVGGKTSLVGGSLPQQTVSLSTARLRRLDPVDADAATVIAGAGITLAEVHEAAAEADLTYGIDFGARRSATIGGTVSTNAVGLNGIAWGPTRSQVLGLEAVLADGSILSSLSRPIHTSVGLDWTHLLVGSEGTLGVVTAAKLQLRPVDRSRCAGAFPAPSIRQALWISRRARTIPGIRSIEWVSPAMAELAGGPFPGYLLVEVGGATTDEVLGHLAVLDPPKVAVDEERHRLWAPRERCTDALQHAAGARCLTVHKLDVAAPLRRMEDVVNGLPDGALCFGHIGLGTLHVNVIAEASDPVDEAVLTWVVSCGGSVAAEHGIGRAKTAWLDRSISPAEMTLARSLKAHLDPNGILNPGVIFPDPR